MRNGEFQVLDYSGLVELTPRQDLLITNMNLFTPHYLKTTTVSLDRVDEGIADFEARRRGGPRNYIGSERATNRQLEVPFFPLDRQINAADIQNFRAYGTESETKTVQQEMDRIMRRLRRYHTRLTEKAMFAAVMGFSHAPSDPRCQYNYYDIWGVTQATANIDFTDYNIDPMDVIEAQARGHIIDVAGDDGDNYEIIVLASRRWFTGLINHPLVAGAYANYPSTQEILRRRLGGNANNRIFEHKNILFIEDISGNIPAGQAFIMPRGFEMFDIWYSPADDIDDANTVAKEIYVWYKESSYNRERKVETETSFLTTNTRPELVVKSTGTFE